MISIEIDDRHISLNGHAGHGEKGKDIVCAAVSALAINLKHSLYELCPADTFEIEQSPGNIEIKHKDLSQRAVLLRSSFLIGVCGIAESYPDHVNVMVDVTEDLPKRHEIKKPETQEKPTLFNDSWLKKRFLSSEPSPTFLMGRSSKQSPPIFIGQSKTNK